MGDQELQKPGNRKRSFSPSSYPYCLGIQRPILNRDWADWTESWSGSLGSKATDISECLRSLWPFLPTRHQGTESNSPSFECELALGISLQELAEMTLSYFRDWVRKSYTASIWYRLGTFPLGTQPSCPEEALNTGRSWRWTCSTHGPLLRPQVRVSTNGQTHAWERKPWRWPYLTAPQDSSRKTAQLPDHAE